LGFTPFRPMSEPTEQLGGRTVSAATLGVIPRPAPAKTTLGKVAGFGGDLLGYSIPWGGATKVASKVMGPVRAATKGGRILAEGLAGAGTMAAESAIEGRSAKETALAAGAGLTFGAGLPAATEGLSKYVIQPVIKKAMAKRAASEATDFFGQALKAKEAPTSIKPAGVVNAPVKPAAATGPFGEPTGQPEPFFVDIPELTWLDKPTNILDATSPAMQKRGIRKGDRVSFVQDGQEYVGQVQGNPIGGSVEVLASPGGAAKAPTPGQGLRLYRGQVVPSADAAALGTQSNIAKVKTFDEVIDRSLEDKAVLWRKRVGDEEVKLQRLTGEKARLQQAVDSAGWSASGDTLDALLRAKTAAEDSQRLAADYAAELKKAETAIQDAKELTQITAENSDLLYLTSQRSTAEAYANPYEKVSEHLVGPKPEGYKPTVTEVVANPKRTLDLTGHGKQGVINHEKAITLLEGIGVKPDVAEAIVQREGENFPVFRLFRGKNLAPVRKALKEGGYDSVHYTEGLQDNWLVLDRSIVRDAPPTSSGTRTTAAEPTPAARRLAEAPMTQAAGQGGINRDIRTAFQAKVGQPGQPPMALTAPMAQPGTPGKTWAQVVKRADIRRQIEQDLKRPIYIGHIDQSAAPPGKKILGTFEIWPEVMRTAEAGNFKTIFHETGHAIDKKLLLSDLGKLTPKQVAELEFLAKPVSAPGYAPDRLAAEGVAEFVSIWTNKGEVEARALAPEFAKAFDDLLKQEPGLAKVLRRSQEKLSAWYGQSARDRILGSMSVGEKGKKPLTLKGIYKATVDAFDPIRRTSHELQRAGGRTISASEDPFLLAWLSRGSGAKAEGRIRFGHRNPITLKKETQGLDAVFKPVAGKIDDFQAYMAARRAVELESREIEHGLGKGTYSGDVQAAFRSLDTPEFRKAFDGLQRSITPA
ncbi:MAG TPA: hypothetical protein VGL40_09495, partial [Bacillota bacterium]